MMKDTVRFNLKFFSLSLLYVLYSVKIYNKIISKNKYFLKHCLETFAVLY